MPDSFSRSFYEPLLVQPYMGLTLELVRRWHIIAGHPKAEHSYRAREGTKIVSEHVTLKKVHQDLQGRYRCRPTEASARKSSHGKRLPAWLD